MELRNFPGTELRSGIYLAIASPCEGPGRATKSASAFPPGSAARQTYEAEVVYNIRSPAPMVQILWRSPLPPIQYIVTSCVVRLTNRMVTVAPAPTDRRRIVREDCSLSPPCLLYQKSQSLWGKK